MRRRARLDGSGELHYVGSEAIVRETEAGLRYVQQLLFIEC